MGEADGMLCVGKQENGLMRRGNPEALHDDTAGGIGLSEDVLDPSTVYGGLSGRRG